MPNCCSVHMALDIGTERKKTKCDKQVAKLLTAAGASRLEVEGAVSLEDKQGRLAEIGGRSGLGP